MDSTALEPNSSPAAYAAERLLCDAEKRADELRVAIVQEYGKEAGAEPDKWVADYLLRRD